MTEKLKDFNVPSYYAFSSLYFFGEDGIGRRRLSEKLGLSESKTRTMIQHLQKRGYIESENITRLSEKGLETFQSSQKRIKAVKQVEAKEITASNQNIAALVTGTESNIDKGIRIRDEAVKAGANGLTTLIYGKQFQFPDKPDSSKENRIGEDSLRELEEEFGNARKGDVLLISSASKIKDSKAGLWSALQKLLST